MLKEFDYYLTVIHLERVHHKVPPWSCWSLRVNDANPSSAQGAALWIDQMVFQECLSACRYPAEWHDAINTECEVWTLHCWCQWKQLWKMIMFARSWASYELMLSYLGLWAFQRSAYNSSLEANADFLLFSFNSHFASVHFLSVWTEASLWRFTLSFFSSPFSSVSQKCLINQHLTSNLLFPCGNDMHQTLSRQPQQWPSLYPSIQILTHGYVFSECYKGVVFHTLLKKSIVFGAPLRLSIQLAKWLCPLIGVHVSPMGRVSPCLGFVSL